MCAVHADRRRHSDPLAAETHRRHILSAQGSRIAVRTPLSWLNRHMPRLVVDRAM